MGMAGLRWRYELRYARRWLGVVCLLALAGGAAITAAEAARRTDTAFSRDLDDGRASDVVINANAFGADQAQTDKLRAKSLQVLANLDRDPLITSHGLLGGANLFLRTPSGDIDQRFNTGSAFGLAAFDTNVGHTIATWRITKGRAPDPTKADEVLIASKTAELTGWQPGTRVENFITAKGHDFDPRTQLPRRGMGTKLSLLVTGVGDLPEELLRPHAERVARVYLTPSFTARYPQSIFYLNNWVRLRNGAASMTPLRARVAIAARASGLQMPVAPTTDGLRKVNQANDPLVNGLWILAALAAVVGLLLAAQSLGRSFLARVGDHAQLRAVGATPGERFRVEFATLAIVALVASIAAALVGYLASPLTPVGAARDAEPHPGFALNLALSAVGAAVLFVGTVLVALVSVVRVSRSRQLPGPVAVSVQERPSYLSDAAARAGFSAPAVVGTRLALQPGRGVTATPVRSVVASLALVIAAVTTTFAFGMNLQRWTTTPRLYGWNWDTAVGTSFGQIPVAFEQPLAHFKAVHAASGLTVGVLTVDGHSIPAIGISPVRGMVAPTVNAGRLPANVHEIALGAKSMRQLHTHLGAVLNGTANGNPVTLTVVGLTTFPAFGNERFNLTGLGTGALGVAPLFFVPDPSAPGAHFNYMLLRYEPGATAATTTALKKLLADNGCADPTCVLGDSRPTEIAGYRDARRLPLFVGTVLALLLVATLLHVLLSTMRRRVVDLAILRAIGFTPRQLRSTMRWQAVVLTATALCIGIPLGLVAGRFLWSAFTDDLGVAPGMAWHLPAIAAVAGAVLLFAYVLASLTAPRVPRLARTYRLSG